MTDDDPNQPAEPEPFRLPPRGVEPLTKPGYPAITDPTHPLWEEQSLGWPNLTAVEAMTEAVRLQGSRRADSRSHPAFGRDYIKNDQAEQPNPDPPPVTTGREKERR